MLSNDQAYAQLPSGSVGVDVAAVPPAPGLYGAPGVDEASCSYRSSTAFRMLPEICCALSFPWWMAARVQARLKASGSRSESPLLVAVVGALLLLPIYVLEGYVVDDAGQADIKKLKNVSAALWAFVALCLFAFGALIAVLRARVRVARGGPPGLTAADAAAACPTCPVAPCCGCAYELAAMDGQLATGPSAPPLTGAGLPLAAPGGAPRPNWATGIFGCKPFELLGDLPRYLCAAQCPTFFTYQLFTRLQLSTLAFVGLALAQVALPGLLFVIGLAIGKPSPGQPAVGPNLITAAAIFWYINVFSIAATSWLRCTVRQRYSIPGSDGNDVILSLFCAPCVLAQLEREISTPNNAAADFASPPPPDFMAAEPAGGAAFSYRPVVVSGAEKDVGY